MGQTGLAQAAAPAWKCQGEMGHARPQPAHVRPVVAGGGRAEGASPVKGLCVLPVGPLLLLVSIRAGLEDRPGWAGLEHQLACMLTGIGGELG